METTKKKYMNPYLAGFLLGLVILASFFLSGQGLGASGAPKRLIVAAVHAIAPAFTENQGFFAHYLANGNPLNNWLVFMVLGIVVGGFFSGAIGGRLKLKIDHSPKITSSSRLWMAGIGGAIFGLGSAFGRGCTSGAALSAMSSFSLSGYITVIVIFGTGFLVAGLFKKFWI